ncbi:NAD(P)-binding protein [Microbispora bryophytorum]
MKNVAIIGGGIAGPVTALALRRAGVDATVYEAYPTGATAPADRSPSPPTAWRRWKSSVWPTRCGRPRRVRQAAHPLPHPGPRGAARGVDARPVGDVRRGRARR